MNLKDITKVLNTQNLGVVVNRLGSVILNPNALTGMAVVGVVVTTGLGIRATFKAMKEVGDSEHKDFFDKARMVWRYYVPVVISGTICIVCIIASNRVSAKERAALASALAVSEEALRQAQANLEKTDGTKTRVLVSENAAFEDGDDFNKRLGSLPKDEEVWCRDKVTNAMFKTTKAKLDMVNGMMKQVHDSNVEKQWSEHAKIDYQMYTINDMYKSLGVALCELGDEFYVEFGDPSITVNSDVTLNGEFMLTIDYNVARSVEDVY